MLYGMTRHASAGRALAASPGSALACRLRASRHPDQGVPAGGLRRRRGPRRRARPGPARPRRRRRAGALLRRRRATRPGTTGVPRPRRAWPAPTPRCSTLGRRPGDGRGLRGRRPRALAHLVRQPRRPPRRRCCTASRTWSPRTASSRCGRGRPSSSAAATRCRPGSSGPRYEAADAVIAVSGGHARRRPRAATRRRPGPGPRRPQRHRHRAVRHRDRGHRRACARLGVDPDRPSVVFVGRITRQKGLPYLLRAGRAAARRRPAGAAAPARRTPRRSRPRSTALVDELQADARRRGLDRSEMLPARRGHPGAHRTPPSSSARRSTSRSASSTSRRWPARPPSSPPPPAASPRSSCDGETGLLVPIEQVTDGTGTPLDPERSSPTSPRRSPRRVSDPARAARDGPGRPARAPWSTSPGTRSPTGRSRSTAPSLGASLVRRRPRKPVTGGRRVRRPGGRAASRRCSAPPTVAAVATARSALASSEGSSTRRRSSVALVRAGESSCSPSSVPQADDGGRGHDAQGPRRQALGQRPPRRATTLSAIARAGLPDHGRASRASIWRVCSASS